MEMDMQMDMHIYSDLRKPHFSFSMVGSQSWRVKGCSVTRNPSVLTSVQFSDQVLINQEGANQIQVKYSTPASSLASHFVFLSGPSQYLDTTRTVISF